VRVLQWVLLVAAIVGGLWLAGLAVLGYLQLEAPEGPAYRGLPVPTILLVGGVAAGVLLALLCRLLTRVSARSRARSADSRLREAVGEVTEELVIEPIEAELEAYRVVRDGIAAALR
jgi:hypothetical protein